MQLRKSGAALSRVAFSIGLLLVACHGCQPKGTVAVRLEADVEWANPSRTLVSFAVPFSDHELTTGGELRVMDPVRHVEIPSFSKCLAPWRTLGGETGYQRAVLVQFYADFSSTRSTQVEIEYGVAPLLRIAEQPIRDSLLSLPQGGEVPKALPILPVEWLIEASLFQVHRPASENTGSYARIEDVVDRYFPTIRDLDLLQASNWLYDRVSVLYNLYVRSGNPEFLREAHRSATLYSDHIYDESAGDVLRGGFDLKNPPGSTWVDLKYLYPQALALQYLLFGNEENTSKIRDIIHQLDRATYLLPYDPGVSWTERHYAFRFLGYLYAYSVLGDQALKQSVIAHANYAFSMQASPPDGLGEDGSFRHYLYDHGEGGTPFLEAIGSPWMSSLMMEALLEYHRLSGDARAPQAIVDFAEYLQGYGIKREHETWEGLHPWYLSSSIDPNWNVADGNEAAHNLEATFNLVLGRYFSGSQAFDEDIFALFRDWDDRLDNPPHKFNWALRGALQLLAFDPPSAPPPTPGRIAFTEVTDHGLGNPSWGFGVGIGDLDADGDSDVVLLGHAGLVEVFRNDGDLAFLRMDGASDLLTEWAPTILNGVSILDLDGDGRLDVALVSDDWASVTYAANRGGFAYEYLPVTWSPRQGISQLAWADFDRDGDLDWLTEFTGHTGGSTIYETRENGQHVKRTDLGYPEILKGCNPVVADFDSDNVGDIFIGQCQDSSHRLYKGSLGGAFTEVTGLWGLPGLGSFNGNVADLDNDGDPDLLFLYGQPAVFENTGTGFVDRTAGSGLPERATGVGLFGDLDNDGYQDFILHGYRTSFGAYRNLGNFEFEDLSENLGLVSTWHVANLADLDEDGDLDLVAQSNDLADPMPPTRLYRNDTATENHWLSLEVRNVAPNTSAVGSKIWLYRSGHLDEPSQLLGYREVSLTGTQALVQHFGLGGESAVDARVRLPDGTEIVRTGLAANRSWTIGG